MLRPKDLEYARLIDELRLKIKHRRDEKPGSIRAFKVRCLHRFAEFNKVKSVCRFYSLYSLCGDQHLRNQATQRDFETGGKRSCFLDENGAISMIVLHIPKIDFKSYKFYRLASRLCLEVHVLSSFKDPNTYLSVCFSRRKGEQSKVKITPKAGGIMKKLLNVLSSVIIIEII